MQNRHCEKMLHIRSKTIIAIILVILAISSIYLYIFLRQRVENRLLVISSKIETVNALVATLAVQYDKLYSARIGNMCQFHPGLLHAFAARDKESLYESSLPVSKALQRENRYFDHIDFILPDGSIFLSVDRGADGGQTPPYASGGAGEKSSLDPVTGGNGFVYDNRGLYYRIVQSVSDQGRHLGSVAFGIRMGAFLEEINKTLNIHTALTLRAEFVEPFPDRTAHAIRTGKYYIFPQDDPFFTEKGNQIVLSGGGQELRLQDKLHVVFPSFIIAGIEGKEIGVILQAVDISAIDATSQHEIVRLIVISAVLLLVASLILYVAFTTLYRQLLDLNETLNNKNTELDNARHELEDQVAYRTAELAAANTRLHEEIELRKEANLTLMKSIEEWQSTFDAITDPVTILDSDLEVVIANKPAQALLSRDQHEIVGRKCYELFAGTNSECPSCPAREVSASGVRQYYEMEHEFLGKTLMVSCSPIYDSGEISGYVHAARDITQEKALKKQLAQAQKMEAIATLAGGIAHDFNNILGAILGNADLLLFRLAAKSSDGPRSVLELKAEDIEAHITAIKKAGLRAKDLVSQILAFSRQSKTQRQNAIITPVIKEAVKLLRASLPANIEIRADLVPDPCHIYCDLSQIHQIFMNLCTNAAQAMAEKGGVLTVILKTLEAGKDESMRYPGLKTGRHLMLAVQDTGHGMAPEVQERIFDPFFTTRDVGEGTGMGLAVIHGIIASHEGLLDVKSEVGAGSTFTVFFPCVKVGPDATQDIILGMPRGRERILFVDDEEDITRMSSRMLEYLGYTVYTASGGEEALGLLRRDSFAVDLLITDYSMPGISGVQLARETARIRPSLPVMVCSGFSESVVADEGAKHFIRKFMSKPLDMRKLAVAIREILPGSTGEEDAGSHN